MFVLNVLHVVLIANTVRLPGATYEELERLNATCSPRDTCSPFPLEENDNLGYRLCECGSHCTWYRTCCVDSPYVRSYYGITGRRSDSEECLKVHGTKESYFMVTSCPRRWHGSSDVKKLCEEEILDEHDPFILAPAMHNDITYKNYFCALCHGARPGEIKLWDISVTKTVRQHVDENYKKALIEKLVFDDSVGKWGIMEGVNSSTHFAPVDIGFVPREYMKGSLRPCIPGLISDCDPEWEDAAVRKKCLFYMAAIYVLSQQRGSDIPRMLRYRNIHCAICNFAEYESVIECEERVFGSSASRIPQLSFTLLIDINPSDGNTVGKVSRCDKGEVYDPFFKKCRTPVCVQPGYVIEGDSCVEAQS